MFLNSKGLFASSFFFAGLRAAERVRKNNFKRNTFESWVRNDLGGNGNPTEISKPSLSSAMIILIERGAAISLAFSR